MDAAAAEERVVARVDALMLRECRRDLRAAPQEHSSNRILEGPGGCAHQRACLATTPLIRRFPVEPWPREADQ